MKATPKSILLMLLLLVSVAACGQGATLYYENESTGMRDTYPESLLTYNTGLAKWSYQDPGLAIHLSVSGGQENQLAIEVVNRGDRPVEIVWLASGFRDSLGRRWRLVHEGVPYWSLAQEMRPTVVAPGQRLTDVLRPARIVHRDGGPRLAPPTNQQLTSGWSDEVALRLAVNYGDAKRIYTLRFDPNDLEDPQPIFGPLSL